MQYKELMEAYSLSNLGAVVLSADGRILSINPRGDVLLHGEGNLTGKRLADIAPELLKADDAPLYSNIAFDEYVMRCPSPTVSGLPADSQFIVFRDATKDACHDMFLSIVNQIEESIILCDEKSRIYMLNDAAEKMDAIVIEDVKGKPITDVYLMQDGSRCAIPRAISEKRPLLDNRQYYTTCFGRDVDIVANNYPIITGGQVLGGFSVMQDWRTLDEMRKQIIDLQDKLVEFTSKNGSHTANPLSAKYEFRDIIHISPAMNDLIMQCRQAAKSNSSIMIYGETGTGKELFAQSIHNASHRAKGPFLAINCAAIPENLLESLLFGTERGAYTGAESKPGLFEQADHGTLLLDELNSMNINLQSKLLRVLQDKRIRRVGGAKEIQVDVRVLSNINIPPYQAIEEEKLRRDLFYRLGVVSITIPPLAERREDIPLLANSFLMQCNEEMLRNVRGIDAETLDLFSRYSWPGNIRELQHAIEHAMNILPDTESFITPHYLPNHILTESLTISATSKQKAHSSSHSDSLDDTIKDLERQSICAALRKADGNVSEAARILQMSRQNLQYRIKRYQINVDELMK